MRSRRPEIRAPDAARDRGRRLSAPPAATGPPGPCLGRGGSPTPPSAHASEAANHGRDAGHDLAIGKLAGRIAPIAALPDGQQGVGAPPLVGGLARDPKDLAGLIHRHCAAGQVQERPAVLDAPGQGRHERVEFGDGRPDYLGAAQELGERADIGRGGEGLCWSSSERRQRSAQEQTGPGRNAACTESGSTWTFSMRPEDASLRTMIASLDASVTLWE
jgi:hypothetical protein